MSTYPQHDKLQGVKTECQAIGDFLSWLADGQLQAPPGESKREDYGEVELAYRPLRPGITGRCHDLTPLMWPVEKLLAAYFEIDREELENEKRAMLESLRT